MVSDVLCRDVYLQRGLSAQSVLGKLSTINIDVSLTLPQLRTRKLATLENI